MIKIGVEQEFVFIDEASRYLDPENSNFQLFNSIVEQFPVYPGDDEFLECKSTERYPKRCYVEGFERHAADGSVLETAPKGLEIRTTPSASIGNVVTEFRESFAIMVRLAAAYGLEPVLVSRHPFKNSIDLKARMAGVESRVRTEDMLVLARRAMVTHGLHVNISFSDFTALQMEDCSQKINYYVPALIPWSFSSPFHEGKLFEGACARNYFRAGTRSMVELHHRKDAHILEFRAFDACGDFQLMAALLQLFLVFLREDTLTGRSAEQDSEQLKHSSIVGFDDPSIKQQAHSILHAVKQAMGAESHDLNILETMLQENNTYAARIRTRYLESESVIESISGLYDF